MRNFLLGASCCVCLLFGGLLLHSEPVRAGGNVDPKWTMGYVYGVPDVTAWRKSIPAGKLENSQPELDAQLLTKTHLVYENGADKQQSRMAFQRMLCQAGQEGWMVYSIDEVNLTAVIHHPALKINSLALKPTKR